MTFSPVDSAAASPDVTAYFTGLGAGTYNIGVRLTDDTTVPNGGPFVVSAFSQVTVKAANDPDL